MLFLVFMYRFFFKRDYEITKFILFFYDILFYTSQHKSKFKKTITHRIALKITTVNTKVPK